jgi:hypothetical protein
MSARERKRELLHRQIVQRTVNGKCSDTPRKKRRADDETIRGKAMVPEKEASRHRAVHSGMYFRASERRSGTTVGTARHPDPSGDSYEFGNRAFKTHGLPPEIFKA